MQTNGGSSAPYLARTPFVPLVSTSSIIGMETESLLDHEGRARIISIVQWNFCPVIFGGECRAKLKHLNGNSHYTEKKIKILYVVVLLLENKRKEAPPHKELGLSNLYAGGPSILYVLLLITASENGAQARIHKNQHSSRPCS